MYLGAYHVRLLDFVPEEGRTTWCYQLLLNTRDIQLVAIGHLDGKDVLFGRNRNGRPWKKLVTGTSESLC